MALPMVTAIFKAASVRSFVVERRMLSRNRTGFCHDLGEQRITVIMAMA
jgi:hypothetical protein